MSLEACLAFSHQFNSTAQSSVTFSAQPQKCFPFTLNMQRAVLQQQLLQEQLLEIGDFHISEAGRALLDRDLDAFTCQAVTLHIILHN